MSDSKGPRIFAAMFLGSHLLLPLVAADLYPFSAFPMFSDAKSDCIRRVEVHDEQGTPKSGIAIGLFTNYVANPKPRIGCWLGPSEFDQKGIRTEAELNKDLGPRICRAGFPALKITQREYCKGETITHRATEALVQPQCN